VSENDCNCPECLNGGDCCRGAGREPTDAACPHGNVLCGECEAGILAPVKDIGNGLSECAVCRHYICAHVTAALSRAPSEPGERQKELADAEEDAWIRGYCSADPGITYEGAKAAFASGYRRFIPRRAVAGGPEREEEGQ